MSEVSESAAVSRSTLLKIARRNQKGSNKSARDEKGTRDERRSEQQSFCIADPIATDQRHYRDAGLKSGEPKRQLRKEK